MLTILFFVTLACAVCGYAVWRGGGPERLGAGLLLWASAASLLTPLLPAYSWHGVNRPLLIVDVILLLTLVVMAMFADRFWPMWLSALQLVAVAGHGVRAYDPQIVPYAYWWLVVKAGYPMLAIVAIATRRHLNRKREGLPEYDWSFQRWRSDPGLGFGAGSGRA